VLKIGVQKGSYMISEFNSMEWFVANARKMSVVTVFLFLASLFAPLTALSAEEPNFYDGPGGYLQSPAARRDGADYRFNRLQNSAADKTNKVVGMALGAAVGGGLVVALGIASSPILAVATLVGSALAGGFVGDMFGGKAKSGVNRAAGSPDFMTWAGGLAGAAAGFMIPGGSIIGAAVGAGLGGMVGNYFANNKDSIADMPSRLLRGGVDRMSGSFMGPVGSMAAVPDYYNTMGAGRDGGVFMHRWYGGDGAFNMGLSPDTYLNDQPGMPMNYQTHYLWHDDNGSLAYPGWENDLYRADRSASMNRGMPEWTMGNAGSRVTGSGQQYYGGSSNYSAGNSSVENPNWSSSNNSVHYGNSEYGDVYSTYVTSDGETFNPGYQAGSSDSLVQLQARYQDAVEDLRNLTMENAPAAQRQIAHSEVQRLERLLQSALR
jgi:hypothetical protein